MSIRFFANHMTSFDRNSFGFNYSTTNPGTQYDSNFVDGCISFSGAGSDSWVQKFLGASDPEWWVHFDFANSGNFINNAQFFSILNSSATPVIRGQGVSTNLLQLQYWNGSAWVNGGATFPINPAISTIDIRVASGAMGEIQIYQNNAILQTVGGLNSAVTNFQGVRLHSAFGGSRFSQIIVADEDTRDMKVFHRRPNGNGFYNADGTGTFTDVNSAVSDDATSIILPNIGHKRTFTKSSITLPPGYIVGGVAVSGRMRVDGTPNDAQALLRIGGTDYNSPDILAEAAFLTKQAQIWLTNPAGGALSATVVNNAEFGLEVV